MSTAHLQEPHSLNRSPMILREYLMDQVRRSIKSWLTIFFHTLYRTTLARQAAIAYFNCTARRNAKISTFKWLLTRKFSLNFYNTSHWRKLRVNKIPPFRISSKIATFGAYIWSLIFVCRYRVSKHADHWLGQVAAVRDEMGWLKHGTWLQAWLRDSKFRR